MTNVTRLIYMRSSWSSSRVRIGARNRFRPTVSSPPCQMIGNGILFIPEASLDPVVVVQGID